MKVSLLGDLHGEHKSFSAFKENCIQVGDLDLLDYKWWSFQSTSEAEWESVFGENKEFKKVYIPKFQKTGRRFFIDGNHDYFPDLLTDADEPYFVYPNLIHIPRGYVNDKTLFIGGADSIDKEEKFARGLWHEQERFSFSQVDKFLSIDKKIEVVISHDAPLTCAEKILEFYNSKPMNFFSSRTLEEVWKKYKPSLWVFGHFHDNFDKVIGGTRFICLNVSVLREFNLPIEDSFFKKEYKRKYLGEIS